MEKYNDDTIMRFGKEYAGKALKQVPARYLLWMYDQTFINYPKYAALKTYIEENFDVLERQAETGQNEL